MLGEANLSRVRQELNQLKTFDSGIAQEGTTRTLLTDVELQAREYVKSLMTDAGMTVEEDAISNIIGTLPGTEPDLAPVWSGSHIDTVLNAGMYDGMVGVIGALEACRMIREAGAPHRRSISALVFASEEPTRFGIGCIGSRTMANHMTLEDTRSLVDGNGISLYQELERLGYTKKDFSSVYKKPGDVFASVELHIEQAPVLEQLHCPIGIVEGICAPSYIQVSVVGQQKHAGSTPMNSRLDPVPAAAEIIQEIETMVRAYGNSYTVATVGKLSVFPNASNVIAGSVDFSVDIRALDESVKKELTERICAYIDTIGKLRGLTVQHKVTTDDIPRRSDARVVSVLQSCCDKRGIQAHSMVSGAYHDSLLIAEFAPMAMIFVPSRDGISHDPREYTSMEDICRGVDVLADSLLTLSNADRL